MLAIVLTAFAAFQVATPAPTRIVAAAAPATTPPPVSTAAPSRDTPSDEYVARARRALSEGNFEVARREFVIAAALDRDAGRLPVAASFGLSRVLFSQDNSRDAAQVLNDLARDAADRGDDNTEACALVDALWLNRDAKQWTKAERDAARLMELRKRNTLTTETRKLIADRTS